MSEYGIPVLASIGTFGSFVILMARIYGRFVFRQGSRQRMKLLAEGKFVESFRPLWTPFLFMSIGIITLLLHFLT